MRSASPAYVPEIDGLRAIAVMAVILFHVQVAALSGGYAGVDVFFVISGYLITCAGGVRVVFACDKQHLSKVHLVRLFLRSVMVAGALCNR